MHTVAALLTIGIYSLIPLLAFIIVLVFFKRAGNPQMIQRFGAVYKGLNYSGPQGRLVLIQPVCFLLRRVHMAWLVVHGAATFDNLWYQILQIMAISIIVAIIPFLLDSYQRRKDKRQATINEIFFFNIVSCILVCNIVSVESNYALGYLVIGIAGIYIGSSLLVMIYTTFKEIKRRIRNKLVIRAYFKQRV